MCAYIRACMTYQGCHPMIRNAFQLQYVRRSRLSVWASNIPETTPQLLRVNVGPNQDITRLCVNHGLELGPHTILLRVGHRQARFLDRTTCDPTHRNHLRGDHTPTCAPTKTTTARTACRLDGPTIQPSVNGSISNRTRCIARSCLARGSSTSHPARTS